MRGANSTEIVTIRDCYSLFYLIFLSVPGTRRTLVSLSRSLAGEQSGAVGACWAHNPEVGRSKLLSANDSFLSNINHLPSMCPVPQVLPRSQGNSLAFDRSQIAKVLKKKLLPALCWSMLTGIEPNTYTTRLECIFCSTGFNWSVDQQLWRQEWLQVLVKIMLQVRLELTTSA